MPVIGFFFPLSAQTRSVVNAEMLSHSTRLHGQNQLTRGTKQADYPDDSLQPTDGQTTC